MEKNLRFSSTLTKIEKVNPLFSRGKAYILYEGQNRNNSYLTRQSIEKAIPTLYNVPVVGEYLEEKDNFGGHGGKLEITDTEIKYKITTKPYGVIPESAKIYWEDVTEKDGTVRQYLVVDGLYLWTGRYEELNTILEEEKFGQSMEIVVENGNFAVVDGQETFKIDEFIFSGLCILGIDKGENPDDHVEPAFESASISVYELDKDSFKREFNQMLAELKFSLQKEGGKSVEDVKQEFEEQATETTETEVVETEEKVEEVAEETVVAETEEAFEQTQEEESTEQVEETVEDIQEESEVVDYESKFNDLEKEFTKLQEELDGLIFYKRQREEQDLASKFSDKLSEDEIKAVFEATKNLSLDVVEEKLLATFGKKNFSLESKNETVKVVAQSFSKVENEKPQNPYGSFFD